jgi:hypothetical protein
MSRLPKERTRRSAPREGHTLSTPHTPVHRSSRSTPLPHDLFPLPLSPFERHFLEDDSPSYPAQFFCRLRFQGCLRQDLLNEALHAAFPRHPLLTAIVHDADGQPPHWLASRAPWPELRWIEQEPTRDFPHADHLDIRARPGLNVFAVSGSERSDLILQVHHAACDALGALDFANDVLTAYANLVSGDARFAWKPLDPSRLRSRVSWPLSGWPLVRWGLRRLPSLPAAWRAFRRKPHPVIPHRPDHDAKSPPPTFPEACVYHFDREDSVALMAQAQDSQTSLTGLLVGRLILALDAWRRQCGFPDSNWQRLMLPISMRSPGDRHMPAANVVSTVFLDYRPSRDTDPHALLVRINTLLEQIKNDHFGLAWLLLLTSLQRLPHAWAKVRRSRRRCLISTLVTNIGPVLAASPLPRSDRHLVVGDMTLEEVEFLPVTRPLQCLSFAVSLYAGRVSLGMRYDSRVLSAEQAENVFDVYVRALHES